MINERYFRLVSELDGDTNFGLFMTPSVFTDTIRRITDSYSGEAAAMRILGSVSRRYEPDSLSELLDYPASFTDLPFGRWMSRNDSPSKSIVLNFWRYRSFTEIEIRGLCAVLTNPAMLGVTRNDLVNESCGCPRNESVSVEDCRGYNTSSNSSSSSKATAQKQCGLIFYLRKYKGLSMLDAAYERDNLSAEIGSYMCSDSTSSCFRLPIDSVVRHALILCVFDYIFVHLMRYVLHRTAAMFDAGVTTTRSQRDLALGYTVSKDVSAIVSDITGHVPGILEHDTDDIETITHGKRNSVLNCYDTPYAKTNFMWKGVWIKSKLCNYVLLRCSVYTSSWRYKL